VTENIGDAIEIRLETGGDGDHFPGCKKCFSFQTCQDPASYSMGNEVKLAEIEADHLPQSGTDVKNKWS
jgi:hypothetical protein